MNPFFNFSFFPLIFNFTFSLWQFQNWNINGKILSLLQFICLSLLFFLFFANLFFHFCFWEKCIKIHFTCICFSNFQNSIRFFQCKFQKLTFLIKKKRHLIFHFSEEQIFLILSSHTENTHTDTTHLQPHTRQSHTQTNHIRIFDLNLIFEKFFLIFDFNSFCPKNSFVSYVGFCVHLPRIVQKKWSWAHKESRQHRIFKDQAFLSEICLKKKNQNCFFQFQNLFIFLIKLFSKKFWFFQFLFVVFFFENFFNTTPHTRKSHTPHRHHTRTPTHTNDTPANHTQSHTQTTVDVCESKFKILSSKLNLFHSVKINAHTLEDHFWFLFRFILANIFQFCFRWFSIVQVFFPRKGPANILTLNREDKLKTIFEWGSTNWLGPRSKAVFNL